MHVIEPKVFLVGETRLVDNTGDRNGLADYLEGIHADQYDTGKGESDLEDLIEVGGRLCYRSFQVGLNANVTRIREDHKDYIANILKSGHGSVLEHGVVSFIVVCSRIATHELVRHRAGTAFSQESMRFVRLDDIPMWIPSCFAGDEWVTEQFREITERAERFVKECSARYNLDAEGTDFHRKKEITSAMRRLAPSGHMTSILVTGNIRALRHTIEMRTAAGAEEEIRVLFDQVARICKERYPAVFQDFVETPVEKSNIPAWIPKHRKV